MLGILRKFRDTPNHFPPRVAKIPTSSWKSGNSPKHAPRNSVPRLKKPKTGENTAKPTAPKRTAFSPSKRTGNGAKGSGDNDQHHHHRHHHHHHHHYWRGVRSALQSVTSAQAALRRTDRQTDRTDQTRPTRPDPGNPPTDKRTDTVLASWLLAPKPKSLPA